jgi:hypothetical protein
VKLVLLVICWLRGRNEFLGKTDFLVAFPWGLSSQNQLAQFVGFTLHWEWEWLTWGRKKIKCKCGGGARYGELPCGGDRGTQGELMEPQGARREDIL